MFFVKLTTKLKFYIAFSSIDPTELYMKHDVNNIVNENILVS